MFDTVVQKTHRVPRFPDGTPAGDGSAVARQLDAALLGVGFTASRELMEHVGGLEPGAAFDLAVAVVRAVRPLEEKAARERQRAGGRNGGKLQFLAEANEGVGQGSVRQRRRARSDCPRPFELGL